MMADQGSTKLLPSPPLSPYPTDASTPSGVANEPLLTLHGASLLRSDVVIASR
jgi:hypothetical protein